MYIKVEVLLPMLIVLTLCILIGAFIQIDIFNEFDIDEIMIAIIIHNEPTPREKSEIQFKEIEEAKTEEDIEKSFKKAHGKMNRLIKKIEKNINDIDEIINMKEEGCMVITLKEKEYRKNEKKEIINEIENKIEHIQDAKITVLDVKSTEFKSKVRIRTSYGLDYKRRWRMFKDSK